MVSTKIWWDTWIISIPLVAKLEMVWELNLKNWIEKYFYWKYYRMSFNCVSKYGLVGGGVFLPYDVQKIIADIWLRMRYREMYGNVTN